MKLFADENIPGCERFFGDLGELSLGAGRALRSAQLRDVDVLLVRSVTRVDRALLEGTGVRFVGSCTAGLDHVDEHYLRSAGIAFAHAPGANARSVVEYVFAALCRQVATGHLDPAGAKVGIVGLGQVGGRLYRLLDRLGFDCLGYDPLRRPGAGERHAASLDELLLAADVVSLHTPLTREGPHATWHLMGERRLALLPPGGLLINAARGGVVDNRALLRTLQARPRFRAVLDVWEGEPAIDLSLLQHAALATPHIAGYSLDGKLRGTLMVAGELRRWLGAPAVAGGGERRAESAALPLRVPEGEGAPPWSFWCELMPHIYDIAADDRRLRAALLGAGDPVGAFERLRKDYPVRREATFYGLEGGAGNNPLAALLDATELAATQVG